MNDYFQHLIDENTNRTPVIRPRFLSAFESPDVPSAPVIDDRAAEIVDRSPERMEQTPAVHPGLSATMEFLEFPDGRNSTAIADFKAETISHPPGKTGAGNEITASAPPDVLSEKATSPEKIIRKNASENRMEDTKGMPGTYAHTQAVHPFPGEAVNPALRKTALKNVRSEPALPDHQPSAVDDAGMNQKSDPQRLAADKVKKTARRVFTTETGAQAADFRETLITPTAFGKQPQIRPLTGTKGGPQISLTLPSQVIRPEKTIKVTIGRIEVRAVMTQAPSYRPQTAPKEPQPKISLEDYLKKQRGGSR
ncbi:MAG: hypothetical protein ABFD66_06930 [Smithella sp.]